MIIASVRFPLPEGTSVDDARKLYEQNLATYENAPGLITKYYVFGGGKGGGIYLWESREAAERFYSPEWRAMIAKKYGGAGEIELLENPVTVDNRARKAKAA
ncbi:MAG: monooxygenase [Methylobacteriaceae bacterium]|nr:monooxygenase [Methylobacteriaceae bacterium]